MNKLYYYVQVTQTYKATREDGSSYFYNEKRYVTELDYKSQTAQWKVGEKPLAMSKERARNIAEGLIMNFHSAQIVTAFWELDETDNLKGGDHND